MTTTFKILWKTFVASTGLAEYQIAEKVGMVPQNLNRKINRSSLRVDELMEIADKLGYEVKIQKKDPSR